MYQNETCARDADVDRTRQESPRAVLKAAATPPPATPRKRPRNLSLRPEDIAHREAYGRRHGTTLSALVGDVLRALPLGRKPARELSPAVRRLYGVAAGAPTGVEGASSAIDAWRERLHRKYDGR